MRCFMDALLVLFVIAAASILPPPDGKAGW
jgi:hypothetical protein